MNIQRKRKHIVVTIIAAIMALSFIGFLFLPYFRVYNTQTGQLSYSITGTVVALGKSTSGAVIKGSTLLLVSQIIGSCGGLLTLIFMLLFIFHKKHSGFIYFVLGLSVLCIAFAISSILLSGPIFQSNNESARNKTLLYSPWYYLTLVISILSFILNLFIIFYVSFSDFKTRKSVALKNNK